ncbi:MAG TPA: hypothetical protein ENK57_13480 [Polyangiaceae bacterium]|nr:hypothetical protein [Polyangiaceae bacterium]
MVRLLALISAVAGLAACATAVDEADGPEDDGFGGDGGFGGFGGMMEPTTTSTTSTGGFDGTGGMAGVGGGMGGQGAGLVCDFSHLNTCATASTLPPVKGDESGPDAVVTGDTSDWFQVDIVEADGGIFESDMSFTVTLDIPPGMDYDLIVHEGPEGSGPNCNAAPMFGQPSGNSETVSHGWDDSQPIGGEDDSRWLSIEVLHVSGDDCGPGFQWTLTVAGNT